MNSPSVIPFPQRSPQRDRPMPQSLEAEQSTLGAMLMERDAVARAVEILTVDDFYRELHKKIFKSILKLFDKGEPIDIVTVAQDLRRNGLLEEVGGCEYLSALIEACPSSVCAESYAKVVAEKSVMRQLLRAANQIIEGIHAETDDVDGLTYQAEKLIFDINRQWRPSKSVHIKPLLMAAYDQIEKQFQHRGEASGISTGFRDLDDITAGLQAGELIVVASRPLMGKTALCFNIAHHIALKERMPVMIFSAEMTEKQVTERFICSEANVKSQDLRRGRVQDGDWHRISNAVNNLYQAPIFIRAGLPLTLVQVQREALRLSVEHGQLGLLVIDYLQLISSEVAAENRTQEIGEIVRGLKKLAQQLDVPILLLSQLSRALEQRENKRPMLSDIRDSGTVEEDADMVAFVYRASYYKRKALPKTYASLAEDDPNFDPDEGKAEIIIGKHRNGPVGTIKLGFQPEFAKFTNLAPDEFGGGY